MYSCVHSAVAFNMPTAAVAVLSLCLIQKKNTAAARHDNLIIGLVDSLLHSLGPTPIEYIYTAVSISTQLCCLEAVYTLP